MLVGRIIRYGGDCRLVMKGNIVRNFARLVRTPKLMRNGTFMDPLDSEDVIRILNYPHPKLREENEEVTVFDKNLADISRVMFEVMYADCGLGLAAPQVGINKKLLVLNDAVGKDKRKHEKVLVNPKVVWASDEKDTDIEVCLSFPGIIGSVTRSKAIAVEYQDLEGSPHFIEFHGLLARGIAHEMDHLDKVLFIDRFSEEDLAKNQKRIAASIRQFGANARP